MLELIKKGEVAYIKSTLIKSRHGFSTRIGGFSKLDHTKSLNLAFGRGDERGVVIQNVHKFADALNVDAKKIISVPQVHSNEVRLVSLDDAGAGVFCDAPFSADGYVTEESDLPIGVKTADCVPILLEARSENDDVIAVSAVHAGWRGTALRIVENAINGLRSLGAKNENIYVAIGPAVDVCCYEVGSDFANEINKKLGQNYENKFIKVQTDGSLYANIKGMNLEILRECGIPEANIEVSEYCTCCNPNLFYSHRGQKGIRGSMMSVICK